MRLLHSKQKETKKTYDQGGSPLDQIGGITEYCLRKLNSKASSRFQASLGNKRYSVFEAGSEISRPYLPSLFFDDYKKFRGAWEQLDEAIRHEKRTIDLGEQALNKTLYTSIMSFSVCYDLWKSGSRKTPGTFFEVLLGSLMGKVLPKHERTKFISIPKTDAKVSTDIVFTRPDKSKAVVIPAKITTRERVVQPFAHQRILNSVFGENRFVSVLLCVSELQRAGTTDVNEICVPGTIKLFQTYLAQLGGIFYLDPPARYLQKDILEIITIGTIGDFVKNKLGNIV